MIQFKINPTQNPQNPSHRPKHCLRKIEDLIFIILLWPLINDQHDDILNRNSCQSLKAKFCSVFQNKHCGLGSELWPQHLSVCHSVSRNKKKKISQNICDIKYSFRTYHFSHKYLRNLSNHCTAAAGHCNSFKFIVLSFREINLQSLPTTGSQFYDSLLSGLQLQLQIKFGLAAPGMLRLQSAN